MPNELTVYKTSSFLALNPDSDISKAIAANMATGESLDASLFTRVKTPSGGATIWTIPGISGDESAQSIVGLLVGYFVRGTLWSSFEPSEGTPPVLVTDDLQRARLACDWSAVPEDMKPVLDEYRLGDGSYDWKRLPYQAWGTGKEGRGKRAKEQRVLFILRENEAFPLVVTAQPGSLRTIRPFIGKLPVAHWQAVIDLSLTRRTNKGGKPYAEMAPRLVGTLSAEEGTVVKRVWTDALCKIVLGGAGIDAAEDDSSDE